MKEDFPGLVNCDNLEELSWQQWPSDNNQVENDWMPFLSTPQNSHIKDTDESPNLPSICHFSPNRILLIKINQSHPRRRGNRSTWPHSSLAPQTPRLPESHWLQYHIIKSSILNCRPSRLRAAGGGTGTDQDPSFLSTGRARNKQTN